MPQGFAMRLIDPRDRLIVALDLPNTAAAQAMVERLGDAVSFYKIGMELTYGGGLGLARELGTPVAVLVTSGTAVSELHAAVCEADLSAIPLIVVSADRPPELQGVGAPQSRNQQHRK
jgi:orotidine-5'-phosphate decarboxylase